MFFRSTAFKETVLKKKNLDEYFDNLFRPCLFSLCLKFSASLKKLLLLRLEITKPEKPMCHEGIFINLSPTGIAWEQIN